MLRTLHQVMNMETENYQNSDSNQDQNPSKEKGIFCRLVTASHTLPAASWRSIQRSMPDVFASAHLQPDLAPESPITGKDIRGTLEVRPTKRKHSPSSSEDEEDSISIHETSAPIPSQSNATFIPQKVFQEF